MDEEDEDEAPIYSDGEDDTDEEEGAPPANTLPPPPAAALALAPPPAAAAAPIPTAIPVMSFQFQPQFAPVYLPVGGQQQQQPTTANGMNPAPPAAAATVVAQPDPTLLKLQEDLLLKKRKELWKYKRKKKRRKDKEEKKDSGGSGGGGWVNPAAAALAPTPPKNHMCLPTAMPLIHPPALKSLDMPVPSAMPLQNPPAMAAVKKPLNMPVPTTTMENPSPLVTARKSLDMPISTTMALQNPSPIVTAKKSLDMPVLLPTISVEALASPTSGDSINSHHPINSGSQDKVLPEAFSVPPSTSSSLLVTAVPSSNGDPPMSCEAGTPLPLKTDDPPQLELREKDSLNSSDDTMPDLQIDVSQALEVSSALESTFSPRMIKLLSPSRDLVKRPSIDKLIDESSKTGSGRSTPAPPVSTSNNQKLETKKFPVYRKPPLSLTPPDPAAKSAKKDGSVPKKDPFSITDEFAFEAEQHQQQKQNSNIRKFPKYKPPVKKVAETTTVNRIPIYWPKSEKDAAMNGTKAQPSATIPPPSLKTQGKMEVKDTPAPTPFKSNDNMEQEELPTATVSKKELEKEPTPVAPAAAADNAEKEEGEKTPPRQDMPLHMMSPKNQITKLNNSLIERLRKSLDQDKISEDLPDDLDDEDSDPESLKMFQSKTPSPVAPSPPPPTTQKTSKGPPKKATTAKKTIAPRKVQTNGQKVEHEGEHNDDDCDSDSLVIDQFKEATPPKKAKNARKAPTKRQKQPQRRSGGKYEDDEEFTLSSSSSEESTTSSSEEEETSSEETSTDSENMPLTRPRRAAKKDRNKRDKKAEDISPRRLTPKRAASKKLRSDTESSESEEEAQTDEDDEDVPLKKRFVKKTGKKKSKEVKTVKSQTKKAEDAAVPAKAPRKDKDAAEDKAKEEEAKSAESEMDISIQAEKTEKEDTEEDEGKLKIVTPSPLRRTSRERRRTSRYISDTEEDKSKQKSETKVGDAVAAPTDKSSPKESQKLDPLGVKADKEGSDSIAAKRVLDFDAKPCPEEEKSLRRSSRISSNEQETKKEEIPVKKSDKEEAEIKADEEETKPPVVDADVKKGRGKPNSLASPVKNEVQPLGCAITISCYICKDFSSSRKWSLDRHFKLVHKLEPKYCRPCRKIFEATSFDAHKCVDPKLFEENNLKPEFKEPLAPPPPLSPSPTRVTKTPTKAEMGAPATFYSARYRDLLHQFSPTSQGKKSNSPNLQELLSKCANLRNGKLDLNYVTPKQMEAVAKFVQGDDTQEKVEYKFKMPFDIFS